MSSDPSTSVQPLDDSESALLRALAAVITSLPRSLDADLQRDTELTFTYYLILMHLSEAPDQRLRMSELAQRVALSVSGATRAVDRLASWGYVCRAADETDRRGSLASITDSGAATLRSAWPVHLASVRRRIFARLSPDELHILRDALTRVSISARAE